MQSTARTKQDGVALITAILVVAIASIISASLFADQNLRVRRTGNVIDSDQAYAYIWGFESFAKVLLKNDDASVDSPADWLSLNVPNPIPIDNAVVTWNVVDMQGRFNVNSMVDNEGKAIPERVDQFKRLLAALNLEQAIADVAVDWIDSNQDPENYSTGAEDNYYTGLEVPYRAANRPMTSISELFLLKGVDRETYQVLEPFVSALNENNTAINVNSAAAPVIMSLDEQISEEDAATIMAEVGESPLENVDAFLNHSVFQGRDMDLARLKDQVAVSSSFFMLDMSALLGDRGNAKVYSLLHRKDGAVDVVWRSEGVY